MARTVLHFRPVGPDQEAQLRHLATILTRGNISKLLRLAVDGLIEQHAGTLAEMAPLLEAQEQAAAAIREAAAERQV